MKYLEELVSGECFRHEETLYLLTCDFKSNGNRLCYSLNEGKPHWIPSNTIVNIDPVYTLNTDNNIVAVKNYDKQNINIS
jgi:hypothetical protein